MALKWHNMLHYTYQDCWMLLTYLCVCLYYLWRIECFPALCNLLLGLLPQLHAPQLVKKATNSNRRKNQSSFFDGKRQERLWELYTIPTALLYIPIALYHSKKYRSNCTSCHFYSTCTSSWEASFGWVNVIAELHVKKKKKKLQQKQAIKGHLVILLRVK